MSYWILQSNPSAFRILQYLEYLKHKGFQQDFWEIDRYYNEIKCGDIVFVWKSKDSQKLDNRGIYAKAKILTEPKPQDIYELEAEIDRFKKMEKIAEPYWLDKEKMRKLSKKRLSWVEYTKFILDKPLLLSDAEVESILSGSTITDKGPRHRGIVHKLDQRQGRALEQIMDSI